jgi:hypothetical protein
MLYKIYNRDTNNFICYITADSFHQAGNKINRKLIPALIIRRIIPRSDNWPYGRVQTYTPGTHSGPITRKWNNRCNRQRQNMLDKIHEYCSRKKLVLS